MNIDNGQTNFTTESLVAVDQEKKKIEAILKHYFETSYHEREQHDPLLKRFELQLSDIYTQVMIEQNFTDPEGDYNFALIVDNTGFPTQVYDDDTNQQLYVKV